MKIIITGGTGMVGGLILNQALQSTEISEVVSLVRKPSKVQHQKLTEVQINDFTDYAKHQSLFENLQAGYFCIGVYTGQVADEEFKKITVDYAVRFAEAIKTNSPSATLCLLSGAGADRTEKSRTSFARYKGMAENQIQALGLDFYSFRPGYIYPVTKRNEPNMMYRLSRTLYPLIKLFGKNTSIKSTELATAMFNVGLKKADQKILENKDILEYT